MGNALLEARKINPLVNESTLRSFAKQYREELAKNPALAHQTKGRLVHKKRGNPVKFGAHDREILHTGNPKASWKNKQTNCSGYRNRNSDKESPSHAQNC